MFTFNGTHADTYGVKVVSVNRSPLPDIETDLMGVPVRDGAYFVRNRLKPREIEVEVKVIGTSEADLRTKTRNIASWLYSNVPAPLVFDDEADKTYKAVIDSASITEVLKVGEGTLKFICPMPFSEGVTQYTDLAVGTSTTVTNGGNYATAPTLYLDVSASKTSIVVEQYKPVTVKTDYTDKVAGSLVRNPNKVLYISEATTLKAPTDSGWQEHSQSSYDDMETLDGTVSTYQQTVNGVISQRLFRFNIIELYERTYGTIPAVNKVEWLRKHIYQFKFKHTGYGSGPSGNNLYCLVWMDVPATYTQTPASNSSATPALLTISNTNPNTKIDALGYVSFIVYAEASDGTTPSSVSTDFAELEVTFKTGRKVLTLTGSFSAGDKIKVDGDTGAVTLNGTNAMHMLSLDSEYPLLQAGTNKIVLPTNVAGTAVFKNRWL